MGRFDYFIVFAEMRTGSNFLEANINSFDGLECHGEAFNPHFIGYPNRTEILGVTQSEREADPARLIGRIRDESDGLGGFRFFHDHDPRVLETALPDPRCAKIVLTRNPVDSYISWKIAQATGQWKLTNVKHARSEAVRFEADEFEAHMAALQAFQVEILNGLQRSGQTAFYVAYEDLQDVEVMNGLAAWLGCEARIDGLDTKLKRQNPASVSEKVVNYDEMAEALARIDRFDLTRTPNFEPRRGPAVPTYVAAPESPLLYLPIRGGPEPAVRDWLAALDAGGPLKERFTQKTLRHWMRAAPGHRSFTVLRHPVARAHAVFCERILPTGPGTYAEIRSTLRRVFKLPIPGKDPGPEYDRRAHREAFLGFLAFLKKNLSGQTSLRVDAGWVSQSQVLEGFAGFCVPDMVLREAELMEGLAILAARIGRDEMPGLPEITDPHAARLAEIHDPEVEAVTREVYQRDYDQFGFGDWEVR